MKLVHLLTNTNKKKVCLVIIAIKNVCIHEKKAYKNVLVTLQAKITKSNAVKLCININ